MAKAVKLRTEGDTKMGLKAPGILTFMISVILTVAVISFGSSTRRFHCCKDPA